MNKKYILALIGCTLLSGANTISAELIINELMQSNIDCIKDDLNEFPDSWVELFNSGNSVEKLDEYLISDSDNIDKAYRLPSLDVEPGGFIIIYCDKANVGLHTDFRLDSGKGGVVYLYHNDKIVSKVENMKKQPAPNVAYGRETDNGDKWGYQAIATPGMSNCDMLCTEILSDPVFSVKGNVFSEPFDLALSIPEKTPEDAVIRYTLDCTEPTDSSAVYLEPLKIDDTTIVRAKLFCDGYLSPRSISHSYINHPRNLTLPLVSIVSDNRYFYDDKEGILVAGNYTPDTPNYEYDWRRPINFEYFEEFDSESILNQLCETRVKGGSTRKLRLKSMAIYANKRFGTKRFNHEFFPDQTPGINEFKSFELRNSGDDFNTTYMRDAIIQQSMGMNCDIDWQPSRPAIVYINGLYKGILNIRPRSNEDYIYSYYDGLEDVDVIENWHELKEGSLDNFLDFKDFYFEEGHTFAEYENLMDISEFCNLMIMNIFFDNKDFPANNNIMWRPSGEGGKWRWIAKDTDFGLGLYDEPYDYPTLDWITTPGFDNDHNGWANREAYTILFRRLLDTDEFRNMFIDRCSVYLGDFLEPEQIIKNIEGRHDLLEYEYDFHRKNLGDFNSQFSNNVEYSKEWIQKRVPAFYESMAKFFNLQNPVELTISTNNNPISINGIQLKKSGFHGQFFPDRKLVVEPLDSENESIVGWLVNVTDCEFIATSIYYDSVLDIDMPYGRKVEIEPIVKNASAVDSIQHDFDETIPYEIYDLSGRSLNARNGSKASDLPSGVYILRQKDVSKLVMVK